MFLRSRLLLRKSLLLRRRRRRRNRKARLPRPEGLLSTSPRLRLMPRLKRKTASLSEAQKEVIAAIIAKAGRRYLKKVTPAEITICAKQIIKAGWPNW